MSSVNIVFWPDGEKPELNQYLPSLHALRWPFSSFELHMTEKDLDNLYKLLAERRKGHVTPTG